jgi:putative transposase
MGNHWHLVLRPRKDDALGRMMSWVGVTHVRRHHAAHRTTGAGHVYQGRFKSFPVQDDAHLLTLCRYVESNARRAKLVRRAEDWRWCRLAKDRDDAAPLIAVEWPVDRPRNWIALVNEPMDQAELAALRTSLARQSPFGDQTWVRRTAKRLGLEFTLNPRGRPRKTPKE